MNRSVRVLRRGLLGAFVFCILAYPVTGTTLVYYGTEKLLEDCEFVVLGHVTDIKTAYYDELYGGDHHEIYTFTSIEVERSWGWETPMAELEIEEIGGHVGSTISIVDGIPRFEEGKEVLLFVERRPNGHFKTFCMFLGAFSVVRDVNAGAFLIRPSRVSGTEVLDAGLGAELVSADSHGRIPFEAFIAAMEQRLAAEGR